MDTVIAQINEKTPKISRISWPAIFAGALTTLVIIFLLNILGIGIGFATIDPLTEANPLDGLGTGTIVWWGLSNLAAVYLGGFVAARMSGYTSNVDGALHGFLSWALYAFISFYFLTSTVGSIYNGMSGAVSGLFGGNDQKKDVIVNVDNTVKQSQDNANLEIGNIKKQLNQLIQTADKYNVVPDGTAAEANQLINEYQRDLKNLNVEGEVDDLFDDVEVSMDDNGKLRFEVNGSDNLLDRNNLKDYLAKNTELSEAEINGYITKWNAKVEKATAKAERLYEQAKQKAIKYSDQAAETLAKVCIIAFIVLLLGAAAAMFGGATGSPEYTTIREERIKR